MMHAGVDMRTGKNIDSNARPSGLNLKSVMAILIRIKTGRLMRKASLASPKYRSNPVHSGYLEPL